MVITLHSARGVTAVIVTNGSKPWDSKMGSMQCSSPEAATPVSGSTGENHRKPQWLSSGSTLLSHPLFSNRIRGEKRGCFERHPAPRRCCGDGHPFKRSKTERAEATC